MPNEDFERMIEKLEEKRNANLTALITALLPTQGDRERLIKIEAKVETALLLANTTRTEDLKKISDADTRAVAAHRRIDGVLRWVIGSSLITVGGMLLTALFVYLKIALPSG